MTRCSCSSLSRHRFGQSKNPSQLALSPAGSLHSIPCRPRHPSASSTWRLRGGSHPRVQPRLPIWEARYPYRLPAGTSQADRDSSPMTVPPVRPGHHDTTLPARSPARASPARQEDKWPYSLRKCLHVCLHQHMPASPMPPSPSDAGYSAPHTASASKKTAAGTGTRTPARTPAAYAHQCTRMQSQTRGRMRASEPSRKHRASARLLTTPAIVFIPRPQPPPLATPHTTQVWPRHHPRPRPHDAALWIRDPHTTRPACP